jgi:signal transduction histidine kinase
MKFSIETYLIFGTSIIIFFILSFIAFVVYYQRKQFGLEIKQKEEKQIIELEFQRKLLENSMEVQEIERRRLAKDLHDEVGALLSVLKMGNNQLVKKDIEDSKINNLIQNNKELIDESISMVRSISKDLVPQTLENFGLIHAIEEFLSKIERSSNIEFSFLHKNISEKDRFSSKIELSVFRIIQELANNALKHAKATKIDLILNFESNKLFLVFSDNGVGFSMEDAMKNPNGGLGLRNLESRLSIINGRLKVLNPESGARFEIEINDCHEKN